MHDAASSKGSRSPLLQFVASFTLSLGLALLVRGQVNPQWKIVTRLPIQTQKAFYVDLEPGSKEPDTISRSPTLEAIFFHDSLTGWAAGDGGVIVRTRDGGQTWAGSKVDFPANLTSLFFHNEHQGWAVGNAEGVGAILRTEDGGRTWRLRAKLEGFELSALHDVWFADARHGWAVGEVEQDGAAQAFIFATQDGGVRWQPQYLSKGRSSVLGAVKFTDARHGWAVGHNLILRTEDGGRQWREQRYEEGKYFFGVDFINSVEGWVVGGSGSLLQTNDGGATWHARALPAKYQKLWLASVRFVNSTHGWVAGDNGAIFSTNDGGQTWELESIETSEYLRDLASTSRSIFAVGNNGVILRRQI